MNKSIFAAAYDEKVKMSSVTPITPNRVQTCPHGLPPGACPVCSGMGGGGGGAKTKQAAPPPEMSYAEMVSIWNQIKAARARKEQAKEIMQNELEAMQNMQKNLSRMADKLANILNKIENLLPSPLNTAFNATVANVLRPIINIIRNFPNFVQDVKQFMQNIQREIYIVAEKLASVFGEIKNFIQKQVSDNFKKFTKKVYKILNLFGLGTNEDFEEDERANTEISIFKSKDVKNLKDLMFRLITKRKEEPDDRKRH